MPVALVRCPRGVYPQLSRVASTERLLHRGSPEHSPREIGARAVFKDSTDEIIAQGESPPVEPSSRAQAEGSLWVERRLRTGRSVVRGKCFLTWARLRVMKTTHGSSLSPCTDHFPLCGGCCYRPARHLPRTTGLCPWLWCVALAESIHN